MENLTFDIEIAAWPEKVWNVLFTDENYPKWTQVFIEGSQVITDWVQGSKILFVDSKKSGMIAVIEKSEPYKEMIFRCTGELKDGVEDYDSPGAKAVDGATERYVLEPHDGSTLLLVTLSGGSMPADMMDYFRGVWPTALDKVKELAEA